jgi:D-sedoheptulose 7-phosphate isomerase
MNWNDYLAHNVAAASNLDSENLEKFSKALIRTRELGKKVWILGNGGSASTAAHAVVDFAKTVKNFGGRPLFVIAPSESTALQTAYANDESFEVAFASTLEPFLEQDDLVWIISVSGKSPNLIMAISKSKEKGAVVAATVGVAGRYLESEIDICITVPSADYQVVENIHIMIMHWLTKNLGQ